MSQLTATGFCKESPEARTARLIGTALVEHFRAQPSAWWPEKDRIVAVKCIKFLAYGTESEEARLHHTKDWFVHLTEKQSDLLFCLQHLATWDEPVF